jgi:hypothetical protein
MVGKMLINVMGKHFKHSGNSYRSLVSIEDAWKTL